MEQHRYVALVRGINVGGHSIISMPDLRRLFESFGLTDVATYINTGNVLLSTTLPAERLARELDERLTAAVGRKMTVFVLSSADLRDAESHNPFAPERHDEEQQCYLMFLSAEPDAARREALMTRRGEARNIAFIFRAKCCTTLTLGHTRDAGERSTSSEC